MVVTATSNTQEARDLANEGLGKGEKMEVTTNKMWVVGNRISETLWLERFVVTTQERYTGMLGKSKLNRVTENIQALQMVYSDLEEYVNRKENARVPFTAAQANKLYRKLNKQKNKEFKEVVSIQFVEKLLGRYYKEGLAFLRVKKEEPAEGADFASGPSTSMATPNIKQEVVRGFQGEDNTGPTTTTTRAPAKKPLQVNRPKRVEREEQSTATSQPSHGECAGCEAAIVGDDFWKCTKCNKARHNYCERELVQSDQTGVLMCLPCWRGSSTSGATGRATPLASTTADNHDDDETDPYEGDEKEEEGQGKRGEVAVSGEKGLTREGNGSNHPDYDQTKRFATTGKRGLQTGTGVVAKRRRRHLAVDEGREDSSDEENAEESDDDDDEEDEEEEDDGMLEIIKEHKGYREENDPDYDYDDDCKRVGAKWTNVKSIAEMSFAELETDEFDLLLEEADAPLPNDILTMEELA